MMPWDMVERALHEARDLDGCIAIATASSRADLRWARTTLTTNGEATAVDLTLIVFVRNSAGVSTASVSRSRPAAIGITEMLDEARRIAAQAPPAEDAADLIEPWSPAPTDWSDEPTVTSGTEFTALSADLGRLFGDVTVDGIELFGYAEHAIVTTWLGSSTGIRLRHCQPAGRLEMTAKSHGRSRSSWWGIAVDDFRNVALDDAQGSLRQGLDWQSTVIPVSPGRHDCLLTPGAMGDLMVDLWWSLMARPAVEGRSAFSAPGGRTRIGERLATRSVNLVSDPFDAAIPSSSWLATGASSDAASVFDNGLSLERTEWIADGTLSNLASPRAFASTHGLPAVASADTIAFSDAAGAGSVADLITDMQDGLLITCLWYNRLVDPQTLLLTGLTRDGVYVVRDGEVIGATTNFRFNDSPVGILGRLGSIGSTARTLPREMGDYAPRVAMPAAVVGEFHLSTVSDAR